MKIEIEIKEIDLTRNEEISELLNSFGSNCIAGITESQRDELLTMVANLRISEVFKICEGVNIYPHKKLNLIH